MHCEEGIIRRRERRGEKEKKERESRVGEGIKERASCNNKL